MKVAIIGCGGMGNVHAFCYVNMPYVTLVGVCDTDFELAQELSHENRGTCFYFL